jgi:hypothetical protein
MKKRKGDRPEHENVEETVSHLIQNAVRSFDGSEKGKQWRDSALEHFVTLQFEFDLSQKYFYVNEGKGGNHYGQKYFGVERTFCVGETQGEDIFGGNKVQT